jgi:hypothetical protein
MPLAALLTRLVGLWILAGAVLKTLYGSPADLPQLIRDLPLAVGTTFKLLIGIELVVGIGALLRPSRGWLPALLLLLAFIVVLVLQVAGGEASCGCFGDALVIAPAVMLALDGTLALLLALSRPWRLEPGRRELGWPLVACIAVLSLALPLLVDRQATPDAHSGTGGLKGYANLEFAAMKGKPLSDSKLHGWLSEEQRLEDGIIVIWRASCEVCRDHLDVLASEEQGQRDVVLLELPKEFDDEKNVVDKKPVGGFVFESKLPATVIWDFAPPIHIEVEGGVVTKVLEGLDCLR